MPRKTAFLYTDDFLSYVLKEGHPLQQRRLQLVDRKLASLGAFDTVTRIAPTPVDEELLEQVHTPLYLEVVRRASVGQRFDLSRYGLGPGDTPAFDGMWEASKLYVGGTADAARLVLSGEYEIAFNVAGGLHHAQPGKASGFCVFNDLAVGIQALLAGGRKRVAYIDIDVHHGDGVQICHWDDPRVLTISLHQVGRTFYPGTGFPDETGGESAPGSAINVPFAPYTGDDVWWESFDAVVPEALRRFEPEALVLQLGADAHFGDPLAQLQVTSRMWMQVVETLLTLGKGVPIVVTGGGGYNIATVERLWTLVTLACAGLPQPDSLFDERTPDIPGEVKDATAHFAREQVALLKRYHGWT